MALEEVTVSAGTSKPSGTATDPWDDTWPVPSGSNRFIILFDTSTTNATLTCSIVGGATLTSDLSGPASGGLWVVHDSVLLEASMPAAGDYTFRSDWSTTKDGVRQFIALRNAVQTVYRGENIAATGGAVTVSVTRPSGTFAAGTRVYAVCHDSDGGTGYTVTGDATEVREVLSGMQFSDGFCFASGVLSEAKATVSVTFTRSAGSLAATIHAVEEVPGPVYAQSGYRWFTNTGTGLGEPA